MRVLLTLPLLLCLLAPPSAGSALAPAASAAGSASFTAYGAEGIACEGGAAFGFAGTDGMGALAWEVPGCEGPWAGGVQPFAIRCPDVCYQECWRDGDEMSCHGSGSSPEGGPATVSMTLRRDGAFSFQWWAWDGSSTAEAQGTLVVTSWPA